MRTLQDGVCGDTPRQISVEAHVPSTGLAAQIMTNNDTSPHRGPVANHPTPPSFNLLLGNPGLGDLLPFPFPVPPGITPNSGVLRLDNGGVGVPLNPNPASILAFSPQGKGHGQALPAFSNLIRSSLLRSKFARYRSYPSRKERSTLDEKMSSPRGLEEGGMVAMTVVGFLPGLVGGEVVYPGVELALGLGWRLAVEVVVVEEETMGDVGGECEKNGMKLRREERGRRRLRYMFSGRRALFEWLT